MIRVYLVYLAGNIIDKRIINFAAHEPLFLRVRLFIYLFAGPGLHVPQAGIIILVA